MEIRAAITTASQFITSKASNAFSNSVPSACSPSIRRKRILWKSCPYGRDGEKQNCWILWGTCFSLMISEEILSLEILISWVCCAETSSLNIRIFQPSSRLYMQGIFGSVTWLMQSRGEKIQELDAQSDPLIKRIKKFSLKIFL